MSDCCSNKACDLEAMARRAELRRVLIVVLAINAAMFFVEFGAGLLAGSAALMADSADMAGDAFVYALSLYALDRSTRWKGGVALAKGGFILLLGVGVVGEIAIKVSTGVPPQSGLMLGFAFLALVANLICFRLLWQFRALDVNMASTFECSRNDLIANSGVILAALLVWTTGSPWPDIAVAAVIAVVFLRSAIRVLVSGWAEVRRPARAA